MSQSTKRVSAIFDSRKSAMKAIDRLEEKGYGKNQVTMLVAENSWGDSKNIELQEKNKAAEGVSAGVTIGGVAGGIAAGLTTVGAVTLTGGAAILATGPIVAALAGAGAGGAAGGIIGGLTGMGFNEVEAKFVEEELGRGQILIDVEANKDRADNVKEMFESFNVKTITVK